MIKIIAHRGARSIAPENTIAAAEAARLIGADIWETDVSVTQDGHLVLFHDKELLRTTNVKSIFPNNKSFSLNEFSLAQIEFLDVGITFIENDPFGEIKAGNVSQKLIESFKTEKIPTLEDALIYTKTKLFPVNLELKEQISNSFPLPKMVIDMISTINIDPELIVISSFNHKWLKEVKTLLPAIEVQALLGDDFEQTIDWDKFCSNDNRDKFNQFETYNINHQMITIDEIVKLKNLGKKVNLFTVNNKDDMLSYIDVGVDGCFTDYPQFMKKLL